MTNCFYDYDLDATRCGEDTGALAIEFSANDRVSCSECRASLTKLEASFQFYGSTKVLDPTKEAEKLEEFKKLFHSFPTDSDEESWNDFMYWFDGYIGFNEEKFLERRIQWLTERVYHKEIESDPLYLFLLEQMNVFRRQATERVNVVTKEYEVKFSKRNDDNG